MMIREEWDRALERNPYKLLFCCAFYKFAGSRDPAALEQILGDATLNLRRSLHGGA